MRKYSFIIPTYQSKKLLKNTMESLNHVEVENSYDFEAVIVDDGSTDGTGDFIKGINRNYPVEYLFLERTDDSSRARARNKGIEKASGEILIFIDADIIVNKDYLRELERCYAIQDDILVSGTRLLMQDEIQYEEVKEGCLFEKFKFDNKTGQYQEYRHRVYNDLSYNAASMINPFLFTHTCNFAVPRNRVESVNGFDEDLKKWGVEDFELVFRMFKQGLKIVINSKLDVIHQFHGVKETDLVSGDLLTQIDENTTIFLQKHPNTFEIPDSKVYRLFSGLATNYIQVERKIPEDINRITIDLKNASCLDEMKKTISELKKGNHLIVVNDHIECTDLDVWLQLQDYNGTIVKYFPSSKKMEKEVVEMFYE